MVIAWLFLISFHFEKYILLGVYHKTSLHFPGTCNTKSQFEGCKVGKMKQKLLKVQYIFINKTSLAQKTYYLETHRFYDLPEYDNLHIPMSLDTTDLIFIQLVHLSSSCSTNGLKKIFCRRFFIDVGYNAY